MKNVNQQGSISVAMCTHNGERYLPEQLASIASQSRLPSELVVCDDLSTDSTIAILEQFAADAPFPVRIVRNAVNLGSTRNFDKAVRLCSGDYIALSDQDDRWKPHKLQRLGAMLDADPLAGCVFSDASLLDGESRFAGKSLWRSFRFGPREQRSFAKDPGALMLNRNVVTGATMLFRKSMLHHFTEIPASWVHDAWITWMSILWMRVLFATEPLTEYRLHQSQQLGVGQTSLIKRVKAIRKAERARCLGRADQFEELLGYLVRNAPPATLARWEVILRKRVDFFRAQAGAPSGPVGKVHFLAGNVSSYFTVGGGGWRSLLKDLLIRP